PSAVLAAQTRESPRSVSGESARAGSKQRQRARAVSRLVNGSVVTGQSPGSAIRFRLDGTSSHADIIACRVEASSVYGLGSLNWSSRFNVATNWAPPATGGALEKSVNPR